MNPADQHHFDTACDDRPYCVIPSHHDVDALTEIPIPAEVAELVASLQAGEYTRVCCGFHNVHCEPPSELCCSGCTEFAHPQHPPGAVCVLTQPGGGRG